MLEIQNSEILYTIKILIETTIIVVEFNFSKTFEKQL